MSISPAAFAHHPELAGKIADPQTSFFRHLRVETLIEDFPELEALRDWFHTDDQRETTRKALLGRHGYGDLWVFAYGSLMWDPALDFAEVRRARVAGWSRRFNLLDDKGGRGTKEAPGLMASLDAGGACEGLAFRIEAAKVAAETEILWRREMIGPGYVPCFVDGTVDGRPEKLLTFVADHDAPDVRGDLTEAETTALIARASGILGSNRDYLANIVGHCDMLGIHDAYCVGLLHAVDALAAAERAAASPT